MKKLLSLVSVSILALFAYHFSSHSDTSQDGLTSEQSQKTAARSQSSVVSDPNNAPLPSSAKAETSPPQSQRNHPTKNNAQEITKAEQDLKALSNQAISEQERTQNRELIRNHAIAQANRSLEGLEAVEVAPGVQMLDLQGRFNHVIVLHENADGSFSQEEY